MPTSYWGQRARLAPTRSCCARSTAAASLRTLPRRQHLSLAPSANDCRLGRRTDRNHRSHRQSATVPDVEKNGAMTKPRRTGTEESKTRALLVATTERL